MSRPRKEICYDGTKSIEANAKANGVTVDAIQYYIRTHNIDRRYEKTVADIEICRSFYNRHRKTITTPYSFIKAWSEDAYFTKNKPCPMSISTVKRLWEYISTDKIYENRNASRIEAPVEVEVDDKGKELMSDALKDIPSLFELASDADVSELSRFLTKKPEMPLVCVGSGGQSGSYLEMLYSMNGGIGKSITPYLLPSISDKALKTSKILLMSAEGKNDDILYATDRALGCNPEWTGAYTTTSEDNKMLKKLEGTTAKPFVFKYPDTKGFITIRGKFFKDALFYRVFTGNEIDINVNLTPESCFTYRLNREGTKLPRLDKINHFLVLYGGWGEPVGKDFESVMAEAGMASATCSDYRNFCHGRFIMASNHSRSLKNDMDSDAAMVILITPRERNVAKQLLDNVIPSQMPVITIETEYDSPKATLDLLVKSNVLLAYIGEKCYGINPNSPDNKCSIDKRYPRDNVKFREDFKRFGNQLYSETFAEAETIRKDIDVLLEEEHKNTSTIQNAPEPLTHPCKQDLFKVEEYDASKYLCYAFRRKNDLHKDEYIPFGNMNKGFPYELEGITMQTSEGAYICGLFSDNTPEHISIQKQLIPNTNGYSAKKETRGNNEHLGRKDWEEFNFDWMMYCVWNKVKGNKEFRDLLLSVPDGAVIIENSSFQRVLTPVDKPSIWGCRNQKIREFGKLAGKYADAMNTSTSKEKDKIASDLTNDYCNAGCYVGRNVMGKILMMMKNCIKEGTEPDIDYELLKSKKIYLLGVEASFNS